LLNAFNHAGITVSIDDFGTGYSNLLMLSVLPAKELKIDKSFVTSMLENEKAVSWWKPLLISPGPWR
jgi:sensor c-di-GMP phosphodiesterase-like protein